MCVQSTSRARSDIFLYSNRYKNSDSVKANITGSTVACFRYNELLAQLKGRENAASYKCKQVTVGVYPEVSKYRFENKS